MNLAGWILRLAGWKVEVKAPDPPKCIICVAPHTSNWDFVLGILAWWSVGRRAGFLMKDTWFFFPLGSFFRALGGIPVPRKRKGKSVVEVVVQKFKESDRLQIAVTPEGTRSKTTQWHTGFLHMAMLADVPCLLGALDFPTRKIIVNDVFRPTGDIEADMRTIKDYYRKYSGLYPDKFSAD